MTTNPATAHQRLRKYTQKKNVSAKRTEKENAWVPSEKWDPGVRIRNQSSAMTSHSSSTSLGSLATSTQERAGKGSVKYWA